MKPGIIESFAIGVFIGFCAGCIYSKPKQESEVQTLINNINNNNDNNNNDRHFCDCGGKCQKTKIAIKQHNKSKKHQNYLLTQE